MRSIVQRHLIATAVFAAAAVWTGVALVSALECLLSFVLVSVLVRAVQRRRLVAERGRARRSAAGRSHGRRPGMFEAEERPSAGGSVSRAKPSRVLYDAERGDWPLLAERQW